MGQIVQETGLSAVMAIHDLNLALRFSDCFLLLKARRVYTLLAFNWYVTNIDTALADAFAIGKRLYPDRFQDIDLKARADAIYTFLVGKPVYQEMTNDYGQIGQIAPFL